MERVKHTEDNFVTVIAQQHNLKSNFFAVTSIVCLLVARGDFQCKKLLLNSEAGALAQLSLQAATHVFRRLDSEVWKPSRVFSHIPPNP